MPYVISERMAAQLGLPAGVRFEQGDGLVLRQGKSYIRFTFNGAPVLVDRAEVQWVEEGASAGRPLLTAAERQLLALGRIPPPAPSDPHPPGRARVTGALK